MADFDAMLARERQMIGRPIEYVNGWSTAFIDSATGEEHEVAVIVYRVPPHTSGTIDIPQSHRVAVYVDGVPTSGTVV